MARRTLAVVEADLASQTALAADFQRRMLAANKELANFKRDLAAVVEEAIDAGDICDDAWDRLDGIVDRPSKKMTMVVEIEIEIDDPPTPFRRLLREDANLEAEHIVVTGMDIEADDDSISLGYQFSVVEATVKNVKPVE